jgi:hypothetical protein
MFGTNRSENKIPATIATPKYLAYLSLPHIKWYLCDQLTSPSPSLALKSALFYRYGPSAWQISLIEQSIQCDTLLIVLPSVIHLGRVISSKNLSFLKHWNYFG